MHRPNFVLPQGAAGATVRAAFVIGAALLAAIPGAARSALTGSPAGEPAGASGRPPDPAEAPAATPSPPAPALAIVRGRVRHAGLSPLRIRTFSNDLDAAACGSEVSSHALLVGRDGGLANAFVEILTEDGRVPAGPTPAATLEPLGIEIRRCVLVPSLLVIPAGSRVEIRNPDGILHDLAGTSIRNLPFEARLPRYRRRIILPARHFERPERIRVTCARHGWMLGHVIVTDNALHATTGPDGRFAIAGLPAGHYLVRAWHGELGVVEDEITLDPGATVDVELSLR